MKYIVKAELYKMYKHKYFLIVFMFNCISLLYGLGILLNWSWISFNGTFDLIQYIGAIWQLLFLIGLPLIFFMYVGANILGGEKNDGQILLEITRVANRKKLVIAKILATVVLILFYFFTNIIISTISYSCLVRQTEYVTLEWILLNKDNVDLLITCLFGVIYILLSFIITMYGSIKYGSIASTIGGIAFYAIMSMLARISFVRVLVPGYFALISVENISLGDVILQIIWCGGLIFLSIFFIKRKIPNCNINLYTFLSFLAKY